MLIDLTSLEVKYLLHGIERIMDWFEKQIAYAEELKKVKPELAQDYLKGLYYELQALKVLADKLSGYVPGDEFLRKTKEHIS